MPERAASSPPPEQHWATRNLAYQDCNLFHILGPKKKEVLIYCVYHQSRMNVHLNVDGLRQGLSFMQESGTGDHSGAESTALANESERDWMRRGSTSSKPSSIRCGYRMTMVRPHCLWFFAFARSSDVELTELRDPPISPARDIFLSDKALAFSQR